jgi:hypothetical protein
MLTTQDPTPPGNADPFVKKSSSASPYSPHLASSDFFLFEHIKHCLQGIAFPSREELLAAIHEIVGAIPRPTLENVFRH